MAKVHVLMFNLNPLLSDDAKEKSLIVDEVFGNYKKQKDPNASLGDVTLISYAPRDNRGYAEISDAILGLIEKNTILLCNSVYDLAPTGNGAYGRLMNLLSKDEIKAIYLTTYSKDKDVSAYLELLEKIFKVEGYDSFYRRQRRTFSPKKVSDTPEIIDAIIELRRLSPPVLISDLVVVTGFSRTTIDNAIARYSANSQKGVAITDTQKKWLKEIMKESYRNILRKYDINEEAYIPKNLR